MGVELRKDVYVGQTGSHAAKTALGKAKAALVLEQPFFATILITLPMSEDATIPTMATDGTMFLYNAEFVTSLTSDELKGVLAHEVGHCIFQHMFRRGVRDARRWNQAGDFVINDMLVREGFKLPEGALINAGLVQSAGGTTEGVYDMLPPSDEGGGSGGVGDPLDECRDAPGDQSAQAQAEQDMRVRVAQAAQAAKMMGRLSAGLQRFVDAALKPKVAWQDVLRRFWNARARTETSWAKPKRRWLAEDIYLPSLSGERLGEVVVFVDCSGSVGQRELDEFAAEIRALHEDTTPDLLHVVYFDSEVLHHDKFLQDDTIELTPRGGGGTAFSPCIDYLRAEDIYPVAAVFLTDLQCFDFGDAPDYPVLWVSTESDQAPWGEVVMMNPKL
jgi:predicted metal-dependent peptidase